MTEAEKDRQYAQAVRRFIAKYKSPSVEEVMYLVDDGRIPSYKLMEELYTISGIRLKVHPSQILGPESRVTAAEFNQMMADTLREFFPVEKTKRKKRKKRH